MEFAVNVNISFYFFFSQLLLELPHFSVCNSAIRMRCVVFIVICYICTGNGLRVILVTSALPVTWSQGCSSGPRWWLQAHYPLIIQLIWCHSQYGYRICNLYTVSHIVMLYKPIQNTNTLSKDGHLRDSRHYTGDERLTGQPSFYRRRNTDSRHFTGDKTVTQFNLPYIRFKIYATNIL